MGKFGRFIITGGGTGYLPVAPGTWGSAGACVVYLVIAAACGGSPCVMAGAMALLAVLASVGCVALGDFAEKAFGKKDPSQCTLDEWAGQAVALCLLPSAPSWTAHVVAAAAAFFAFRFFDIVKPAPAGMSQKLRAGWGIVCDDLVAGIYANLLCQVILRLWVLPWVHPA